MVLKSNLATGFFRRNARSGGVAEGGCGGEFRRARAFRRSEAEAVSCPDSFGKKFGFHSGDTAK